MDLVLHTVTKGSHCRIYAMEEQGECLVLEFIAQMELEMPDELRKLTRLLDEVAQHGVPHNPERCGKLGDGLFEFKTKRLRVPFFWDAGRIIICTHGFVKKTQKTPRSEIDRARKARMRYEQAKAAKQLRIVEE